MLRILAGQQEANDGDVRRRKGLHAAMLPQEFALDEAQTADANVRLGAKELYDLLDECDHAEETRRLEIETELTARDGWDVDVRRRKLIDALGIPVDERPVSSMSGGEKRRIAIARTLVAAADLLILDEPTNHLDASTIEWLETFLQRNARTLLLVTHDRYFLDRVCTRILELRDGQIYSYPGNYTAYLTGSAERQAAEIKQDDRRKSFIRRELDWVRRGPKARTTKGKGRLDRFYEAAAQEGPNIARDVDLLLPAPPRLGTRVVELEDVCVNVGDRPLVRGLNLEFTAGTRLGIVGPNGIGKTTLLRVLMGQQKAESGTVLVGPKVMFNYIDQGRVQLNNEKTVLDEVGDGKRDIPFGSGTITVWSYLHRFLFTDDRINTLVKDLSGGERNRLLLAKQLIRGGNLLILDEPTNDLDLATLRVLEEGLAEFGGCVIVVSHDRYFLNRVCTAILAFEGNGEVVYQEGDYDYYREKLAARNKKSGAEQQGGAKSATGRPSKRRSRLNYKQTQELAGMEATILAAEEKAVELETLLADPDLYATSPKDAQRHGDALKTLQDRTAVLYERWAELEALANS